MAPRRPRSTSNALAPNHNPPRAPTSSPLLRKQIAAASDSIYQNNLTVLKRGDPTVVSIIDQFSHVCLYNYNGKTKKWAKEGFEGSMFVVEHADEPIYGIHILNRMGTGDYIRRIYPEDDMEVFGKYLMYRFYPEFTQKRLAMNLPYPIPDQYRFAYDEEFGADNSEPDDPDPTKKRKKQGNSITLGLWAFQQEAHEPLEDVMMRLRECVKQGLRYPEQLRYFPGRQCSQPNGTSHLGFNSQSSAAEGMPEPHDVTPIQLSYGNGLGRSGPSEVDMLFAKLQPPQPPASHASSSSHFTNSWFAAPTGPETSFANDMADVSVESITSPFASMNTATSSRGLALLGSIFASVSQNSSANGSSHDIPSISHQLPPHPEEIQIVSPKPQSSTLPQILNQNVISSLLGLSPISADSRSSSAALSSNSSQRSGAKRYEGDNELSENEGVSEGSNSASSTILNAETDPFALANGPSYNLPSVSLPHSASNAAVYHSVSVQGDVTPRAGLRAIGTTSPSLTPQRSGISLSVPSARVEDGMSSEALGISSVSPAHLEHSAGIRARSLVPFSTDSELWPYPRPPLNDIEQVPDTEVVELDFSDTRALSDPSIFKEKQAKQGKGEKKRKTRQERAVDKVKEREAIANSWDDPIKGQVTLSSTATASSLSSSQAESGELNTRKTLTPTTHNHLNGESKFTPGDIVLNSTAHAPTAGANGAVGTSSTADVARQALLATLNTHHQTPLRHLSRKQFIQEVLALIYADNSFVDSLYAAYCVSAHP